MTYEVIMNFYHKNMQNLDQKVNQQKKHRMFRATNLRQFRESYTNTIGDVEDI